MLNFFLVVQVLFLPVNIYCHNTNLQNNKDSLGNKAGLCVEYDIEHIKLSEKTFVNNEIEYVNYFSKKGDTISVFNWAINATAIKKITERILDSFIVNDFTYASGSATLLLLVDYENNIFEIRVMRGITEYFNNELLRVIDKIEKDLIFICSTDCKIPIVTPFVIRLDEVE